MEVARKTRVLPLGDFDTQQWIHLLDQLGVVMLVARSPEAQFMFPCFRPRRRATAFRHLLHERERVVTEMDAAGTPQVVDPSTPSSALAPSRRRSLDIEFEILAEAFDRCAEIAARRGQAALARWLAGRARMHRSHALLIATY